MPEPFERKVKIVSSDCDRFQRLRLSALFSMLQEASICDVERAGVTRDRTLDKGLLWVISRMKIEMDRPIHYDEKITITTSPGDRTHMVFPRYYTIRDEKGRVLLKGAALWLLISQETRTPVSPEKEGIEIPGVEEEGRLDLPMGLSSFSTEDPSSIRTVVYSDIDLNGHVNNTRYLDWIDDLFDLHFHEVTAVRKLQINYVHEVEFHDQVSVFHEYHNGRYRVDGRKGDTVVFQAEFEAVKL